MKYLWVICVLSVIASIVAFQAIPEGMEMPATWSADGDPDRSRPAWKGLFIPPAVMVFMVGAFAALKWVEPRKENLQKSLRARDGFALAVVLMMLVLQFGTIAAVLGYELTKMRLVLVAAGLAFIIMGNFMGKNRSDFFIGIQTPWNLSDEDNWRKTHRFGGKLFMFAGAMMLAGTWVLAEADIRAAAITCMVVPTLIPVIYSWWLWRQEQAQESSE